MNWYDELFYCIQSARRAGVTPDEFKRRTVWAWTEVLEEEKQAMVRVFTEDQK